MEPIPVSPRSSPPQNSSDALAPQLERLSPMGRALSLLPGLPGALISPCDPPCYHPFPGNSTFSQRDSDPVTLQTSSHPFSSENSVSLCFSIKLPLLLYHFSSSFFPLFWLCTDPLMGAVQNVSEMASFKPLEVVFKNKRHFFLGFVFVKRVHKDGYRSLNWLWRKSHSSSRTAKKSTFQLNFTCVSLLKQWFSDALYHIEKYVLFSLKL